MTLDEVKNYFGYPKAATDTLGLARQSWCTWIKAGYIPMRRQAEFEKITNGKLKASLEHTAYKKSIHSCE